MTSSGMRPRRTSSSWSLLRSWASPRQLIHMRDGPQGLSTTAPAQTQPMVKACSEFPKGQSPGPVLEGPTTSGRRPSISAGIARVEPICAHGSPHRGRHRRDCGDTRPCRSPASVDHRDLRRPMALCPPQPLVAPEASGSTSAQRRLAIPLPGANVQQREATPLPGGRVWARSEPGS